LEDVARKALQHICSCMKFLLIFSLVLNPLYAATQGKVGRTGSQGSISISLVIPDNTRLIAEDSKYDDAIEGTQSVCLKVFDTITHSTTGFYNIAGLDGQLQADYDVGKTDYSHSTQSIKLSNTYLALDNADQVCSFEANIATANSQNKNSAVLLMLIAE